MKREGVKRLRQRSGQVCRAQRTTAEPEIKSKINALLQSKRASELATFDGKVKLSNEIKAQIEIVLGVSGLSEVIFTSFIML